MSLDFDVAALQTQHDEEEEYDQEEYERQQELQKLLTDLPDDMLEDSGDDASQMHDGSVCGDHTIDSRTQHAWDPQTQWNELQGVVSTGENGESNYEQTSYCEEYTHEHGTEQFNGHVDSHHAWIQQQGQSRNYMYEHGGYAYPNMGTNPSVAEREFGQYPQAEPERDGQDYADETNSRKHVQGFEAELSRDNQLAQYKVSYNPYQPTTQAAMFSLEGACPDGRFDQLQREFLDTAHNSADQQQIAQLQILNKAQFRQMKDLKKELEDCKRNMRFLEHQLAIVKGEKEGLTVSLKESGCLLQEAKEREIQLQGKISALELQIETLTHKECESEKKQQTADAMIDSLKQQVAELCRSETLSRARQQHDRDLMAIHEQHEAKVLVLQQKMDAQVQALEEQTELGRKLQEQVKQLERQRDEERLERATVVNTLTQCLEESQQQCANLLHTGTIQEMNQLRMQLQQVQSAKKISDNMNKSLQEELCELKEHITLYESAIKLGIISLDSNGERENQLSESYVELGIKKVNWKSSQFQSSPVTATTSPDTLLKTDMAGELKAELKRLLASLKTKRQKISQLEEELQQTHAHSQKLQDQLDRAQRSVQDSRVRETSLEKQLEVSSTAAFQEELQQLRKEKKLLQDHVEKLESRNSELKEIEKKVKADNLELCTKMKDMIQEMDKEKQEAAERYERTHQQFRDDVVNHVRTELAEEHAAQIEALQIECQERVQQLEQKLADLNREMVAVQECYIMICREKDTLEENLRAKMIEERTNMEKELRSQMDEERAQALAQLKAELEARHSVAAATTKALWLKDRELEIQHQVEAQVAAQVALIKTTREADHNKELQAALETVESQWAQRLEKASTRHDQMFEERDTQTEELESKSEVEAQLAAQKVSLGQEADRAEARGVEEAVQRTERELHNTHLEVLAQKVQSAVSSARERWLQELTSLPEYKANLQAEKEDWERRQEQEVAQKMASLLTAAEEKWRREQEVQLSELQEEVQLLQRKLEQSKKEAVARSKAELAQARAVWNREKQEEISHIQAQNEKDYRTFLDKQRCKLEEALKQAKEEAIRQKEVDFQRLLRDQQESWSRAERKQYQEEALAEVQGTLSEIQDLIKNDPKWLMQNDKISGSPWLPSSQGLRAYLQTACKSLLLQAVDQTKQCCEKVSEDQLNCMLKEQEDKHKREIDQIRVSMMQSNEQPCRQSCADNLQKLQKQCKGLQRHLEKACRQLQQTVRDNKAAIQQLKEEHEDAIQKEREESLKKLEEMKRSSGKHVSLCLSNSSPDSQQSLLAALEEMKEQYLNAVGKIRSDMLRYIQESKARAAEMIRMEVLRERQDTARKMRKYYLTCLQELLEDGGKAQGAEKKIINAASKLAAMAKVLETPVSKKQGGRSRAVLSTARLENPAGGKSVQPLPVSSDQITATQHRVCQRSKSVEKHQLGMASNDRESKPAAEHSHIKNHSEIQMMASKGLSQDSMMSDKRRLQEDADSKAPPNSAKSLFLTSEGMVKPLLSLGRVNDEAQVHVTLRNQSREPCMRGESDHFTAESAVKPFLIEEAPVRDGGQSNWNVVGTETYLDHQNHASMFPSDQLELPNAFTVSETEDTDDDWSHYMSWSTYRKMPEVLNKAKIKPSPAPVEGGQHIDMTKTRNPVPGSEGMGLRPLCSKSLFSEMKASQQDSGFDSPLSLLQK